MSIKENQKIEKTKGNEVSDTESQVDSYNGEYSNDESYSDSYSDSKSVDSQKSEESRTDDDDDTDDDDTREMLENIIKEYSELKRTTIAQKEELERKIKDLTHKLNEATQLNETRKEQVLQSANSMKKILAEMTKMKNEREDLVTQIEEERKNHAETIKQLHTLQGQIINGGVVPSELEMTFRVLFDGTKVTDAILIKNVDTEKEDLRMQQSLLEKKVLSLNQDIVLLKQEKDSTKEQIKKSEKLIEDYDELNKRFEELNENYKKIKKENETLKKRGSGLSGLSFKSESNESSVLKSYCESLFTTIQSLNNINELNNSINEIEELMKDHFYHRLMFLHIQNKCISILNPTFIQYGYTTKVAIEQLYLSTQSHSSFQEKLPENLKNYDIVLREIYLFNDKFKKKDISPIKLGDDGIISSSRTTISRKIRRGSEFSGVYSPLMINIGSTKSSPFSSSTEPPRDKDTMSSTGEAARDVDELIAKVNQSEKEDIVSPKDDMNIITHVWEVNGTIWACKKVEGNKSMISTFNSMDCMEITNITLQWRISAVYSIKNKVICGSENGTINVYDKDIKNEVKCDLSLSSRIVEIGSEKDDIVWILSEQGDFAIIEFGKKMKFKWYKLKIPSFITSACVLKKMLHVGTIGGVFKTEFPPSPKSKFTMIKEIGKIPVSNILALHNSLYIASNTKDCITVIQKGKQPITFEVNKPNTLTPFINDVWVCCGNGSVKVINNTDLKLDNVATIGSSELVGGCILNIENPEKHLSNYLLFFGSGSEIKSLVTGYYRHSYLVNNKEEGICSKCKGKVHLKQGLLCEYCNTILHNNCVNFNNWVDKICSRDPKKQIKHKENKTPKSSVLNNSPTPRRSSSVSVKYIPPQQIKGGESGSDSRESIH
ncbi:hypothetical protein, conserved [Entamoeba dispar SAW760]|uniref:Phorbol-ester/DAG-type domain-containing protein n=1 Tax=Entamoeba dispar (strain ATCC PRA-260 / SAW760) TaxID=370354 RepID=B0EQD4_ENTDS|nr:uncharacterized protein EDI_121960 [Entamoeba dispar SAW760]EDR23259.1 hypothetical protein, conserved [Entamoeba dispar SAW760]|eukprot:EDR23259.1 hypothetical protein, conserved [Entamoeba dispar SAW760]